MDYKKEVCKHCPCETNRRICKLKFGSKVCAAWLCGWFEEDKKQKENGMNRDEHLQWCKDRALKYVNIGDVANALASFTRDMSKHEETKNHPRIQIGVMLMLSHKLSTPLGVEKFINGFN